MLWNGENQDLNGGGQIDEEVTRHDRKGIALSLVPKANEKRQRQKRQKPVGHISKIKDQGNETMLERIDESREKPSDPSVPE